MTTKRREFLLTSIGATLAVPASPAATDPRQIVSKLANDGRGLKDKYDWPCIPEPEDFWAIEAAIEFQNELRIDNNSASNVPGLLQIAVFEQVPAIQLMAIASMRIAAYEVMADTIKLLEFWKPNPGSFYACQIRWASAITLGLMGPVATEAMPALRARLEREEYADVLAAVEWAVAEIHGAK